MNASIIQNHKCKDCGWPVLNILCNDGMGKQEPYASWDWWYYCSNKTCVNHEGEGVFQNHIDWVVKK